MSNVSVKKVITKLKNILLLLILAQILLEKSMPISRECNGILQKMNDANIEPDALQRIAVDLILGAGDTVSYSIIFYDLQ